MSLEAFTGRVQTGRSESLRQDASPAHYFPATSHAEERPRPFSRARAPMTSAPSTEEFAGRKTDQNEPNAYDT